MRIHVAIIVTDDGEMGHQQQVVLDPDIEDMTINITNEKITEILEIKNSLKPIDVFVVSTGISPGEILEVVNFATEIDKAVLAVVDQIAIFGESQLELLKGCADIIPITLRACSNSF